MNQGSLKSALSILTYLLLAYLGLVLLVYFFQHSLLYFPDNYTPPEKQLAAYGMKYWPSEQEFRGLIDTTEQTPEKGTVVIFHGNAGAAHHRSYYIDALSQLGMRVILAEYPGYGGRPGECNESSFTEDAVVTLEKAYNQFGAPLYVWGESLGAGVVASAVANAQNPVDGIVLFTPWDTLPNVAQTHYWYLPTRWLVKDRYDSVKNLQNFDGNVAVILAENDQVIPVKHGKALFSAINSHKKLWEFEGAGHNTVPISSQLNWWKEVAGFIAR